MYCHLFQVQLNPVQRIQNALARAVVAAPRFSCTDHIFKLQHWFKVQECIEYKFISATYKLLQSSPRYLRDLIIVQPSQSTRSSTLVTLFKLSDDSSLKITNRSFQHATPHLWNKLPSTLCVPHQFDPSSSPSSSPSSYSDPGPLVDLSRSVFHSRLKTFRFFQSLSLHSRLLLPQSDFLELWPLFSVSLLHLWCIRCFVPLFLVVSTSAIDYLERLVSEMTCYPFHRRSR